MNEDRVKILAMLQEGKITVEEAARLLEATEADNNANPPLVPSINPRLVEAQTAAPPPNPTEGPFNGAFLVGARLGGAKLDGAKLEGAFLLGADLRNADLRDADLRGAFLAFADLCNANLRGATINGAFLLFANGAECDLAGVNLSGAFMPFTRLHHRQPQVVPTTPAPIQPLNPANE